ncbi:MAG: PhzF family phenazine biosynthesis protein [Chloroflexi bacterium]|nr:PhzF family phenazine biosynthesis protein [Chloroflexota bacterium]
MTRRFRFRVVDVFTDRPLQGNPLAVFPEAEGLTDDEMQAVAREMNLSETSFVLPPTEAGRAAGADYHARFFTPGTELPFAGHPSLGTAFVLAQDGRFGALSGKAIEVRQELVVGVLPIRLDLDGDPPTIRNVTMTQAAPELIQDLDEDEIDELCEALEVDRDALGWSDGPRGAVTAHPQVISTGLAHLIVPFRDREVMDEVDRERIDDELGDILAGQGAVAAALVAPGAWGAVPDAEASVRLLESAQLRIEVDPATGSAAGPIAVLLGQALGVRDKTYRIVLEQGTEIDRPSRMVAEADFSADGHPGAVRVSGSVVSVIEGWLTLP